MFVLEQQNGYNIGHIKSIINQDIFSSKGFSQKYSSTPIIKHALPKIRLLEQTSKSHHFEKYQNGKKIINDLPNLSFKKSLRINFNNTLRSMESQSQQKPTFSSNFYQQQVLKLQQNRISNKNKPDHLKRRSKTLGIDKQNKFAINKVSNILLDLQIYHQNNAKIHSIFHCKKKLLQLECKKIESRVDQESTKYSRIFTAFNLQNGLKVSKQQFSTSIRKKQIINRAKLNSLSTNIYNKKWQLSPWSSFNQQDIQ